MRGQRRFKPCVAVAMLVASLIDSAAIQQ